MRFMGAQFIGCCSGEEDAGCLGGFARGELVGLPRSAGAASRRPYDGKGKCRLDAGHLLVPGHWGLTGVDLAHGDAVVYWAD